LLNFADALAYLSNACQFWLFSACSSGGLLDPNSELLLEILVT